MSNVTLHKSSTELGSEQLNIPVCTGNAEVTKILS